MHELLADSLEKAHKLADESIIHSSKLERSDRERLVKAGLLEEIIRGWYSIVDPSKTQGTSTHWYASYWNFARCYLNHRLDQNYCLSAECSLDAWLDTEQIIPQLVVITNKSTTSTIKLPFNSSILIYYDKKNFPKEIQTQRGLRVVPLETALVSASPTYYKQNPLGVELLLRRASVNEISRELLARKAVAAAGRIASLYKLFGLDAESTTIVKNMEAAGLNVKVTHDLQEQEIFLKKGEKVQNPVSGRIKALWYQFREDVIKVFDPIIAPVPKQKLDFSIFDRLYVSDAYNSLSIEGHTVTPDLIEKIRQGKWDPSTQSDSYKKDMLAAKGYKNAFDKVKESIAKVISGSSPAAVIEEDLQDWYRELFSPFVRLGILPPENLAGYRNHRVFINNSRHIPPKSNILAELMQVFFQLLEEEEHPAVKAVLGHFFFVYIHPYMDGNGRLGRFIMNFLFATGGYPWTIVEVLRRDEYINSLEQASVKHNIIPFAKFIASEVTNTAT